MGREHVFHCFQFQEFKLQGRKICYGVVFSLYSRVKCFATVLSTFLCVSTSGFRAQWYSTGLVMVRTSLGATIIKNVYGLSSSELVSGN